jgi:hypothetical protein
MPVDMTKLKTLKVLEEVNISIWSRSDEEQDKIRSSFGSTLMKVICAFLYIPLDTNMLTCNAGDEHPKD